MKQISIKVPQKKETAPVPAGLHPFVLYGCYHVGVIPSKGGFDAKDTVILAFELPEAEPLKYKEEDGTMTLKPRIMSKRFNLSFHEKSTLRIQLESWRGRAFTADEMKAFELQKLLGASGHLQVMHQSREGKTHASVSNLLPSPKGTKYKGTLAQQLFSIHALDSASEVDELDLPDWIKELIKSSEDYTSLVRNGGRRQQEEVVSTQQESAESNEDDIPF
jgi:hypothetical protein